MTLRPWQKAIVERGELYRVGGAVRDRLMDSESSADNDFLVRDIEPGELEAILAQHGRVTLVGKSFGVYKFSPADEPVTYDIVYPRREVSTGVGHGDFRVTWDWTLPVEEDLRRRDFTINAVAEKLPGGDRIDPFGGVRDMEKRVLRMIFPEAFVEDPLRVVRGARFGGRFHLRIDPETWERMRAAAPLTSTLSPERMQDEASKILTQCAAPGAAIELLRRLGVLAIWLPELDRCFGVAQNEYHPDDVYWHSLKTCDAAAPDNLVVRWAALLHDTGKVDTRQTVRDDTGERVVFYGHEVVSADHAVAVLDRLRYSNAFVARCQHLVREHMFLFLPEWKPATLRRFMRRVGVQYLDDLFALREADCRSRDLQEEIARLAELRARVAGEMRTRATLHIEDLAVDGSDVMAALGIPPGPEVGRILEALLERVLEAPELNERDRLREILKREGEGLRRMPDGGENKSRKPA